VIFMAKEYTSGVLTSLPATGTTDPGTLDHPGLSEAYRRLHSRGFADWRLSVGGRVAAPTSFSLSELKRFPSRTQITRHTCEEGWTAIGEWTGLPLSLALDAVGMLPSESYVVFYSYDDWGDSIDMLDVLHPQIRRVEREVSSQATHSRTQPSYGLPRTSFSRR
jgi:DMSO/TMAO reductase YedYZ molybdopterin-dependent catalytic subunit